METAFSQAFGAPIDDRVLAPFLLERQAYALIERARPIGPSARVLDLGSGSGVVGRILRQRLGRAAPFTRLGLTSDLFAARHIRRPGSSAFPLHLVGLPFEDSAFDLVFCQETLQNAPDPAAALSEIQRVLSPRGRLLLSTPRSRREQPLHDPLGMVAERQPTREPRFTLSDPETLHELLRDAGFTDIRIEIVMISESFRAFPVHIEAIGGSPDMAPSGEERARRLAALEAGSKNVVETFATEGGYVASSSANVVFARARP
jgi:SAM-dependent methyltransferase